MVRLAGWAMRNERIEGPERDTDVVLARSSGAEHGRTDNTRVSRSQNSRITQLGWLS